MDTQLVQSNQNNQLQNMPLNETEEKIAMSVWHINQITAFPLTDHQIEAWSKTIHEIRPNQDVEVLQKIINMMKMGFIEYDTRMGIQNIFKALREHDPIRIGYTTTQDYDGSEIKNNVFEGEYIPDGMIWEVDQEHYEKYHFNTESTRKLVY